MSITKNESRGLRDPLSGASTGDAQALITWVQLLGPLCPPPRGGGDLAPAPPHQCQSMGLMYVLNIKNFTKSHRLASIPTL